MMYANQCPTQAVLSFHSSFFNDIDFKMQSYLWTSMNISFLDNIVMYAFVGQNHW